MTEIMQYNRSTRHTRLTRITYSSLNYQPIVLLHSMIGYWQRPVVRPSVCDAVHCGSQGWCTRLKLAPACSQHTCSYLFLLTLLLQDVSFSQKMHHKKRTAPATNLSPNTQLSRSSAASRLVNNDTVSCGATAEACDDCTCREMCGLRICGRRSAVIVNCMDSRTDSKRIFYSEVEMLC